MTACTPKTPAWQPNNIKNTSVICGYTGGDNERPRQRANAVTPGPNHRKGVADDK